MLYVINNGAFYKVNQLVPDIQDVLAVNQVYLSKLLVKVRPEKYFKPIVKPQLDPLQHAMLEKFAAAINRPDLIKSASSSAQDENSPELEDWQIQL